MTDKTDNTGACKDFKEASSGSDRILNAIKNGCFFGLIGGSTLSLIFLAGITGECGYTHLASCGGGAIIGGGIGGVYMGTVELIKKLNNKPAQDNDTDTPSNE